MNDNITGHTGLIGLLGSPVAHSISPLMHNAAFSQLGLDYVYLCFDVDQNTLADAVKGLRNLNAAGWNCTMPNKQKMCELCDVLSPAAKMSGAVNTVVNDKGILTGYNTDGIGYMRAIKETGVHVIGKTMTLLGAGGASTAIAIQAALDGVAVLNIFHRQGRSWAHAKALTDMINKSTDCQAVLYDIADQQALKCCLEESVLLTNGTSVGMKQQTAHPANHSSVQKEEDCILPSSTLLPSSLAVSDVIYNPRETPLLKMAKKAGCTASNGLYMLLYQGAEAFRLWTGKEMPVSAIKAEFFD